MPHRDETLEHQSFSVVGEVETLLDDVSNLHDRIRVVCSASFCAAIKLALLRHDPCLPHANKAGVAAPDDLARFGKHVLDLYLEWQEEPDPKATVTRPHKYPS